MQTNNTKNIVRSILINNSRWLGSLSSEITIQKAVIRNNVCRLFLFAFSSLSWSRVGSGFSKIFILQLLLTLLVHTVGSVCIKWSHLYIIHNTYKYMRNLWKFETGSTTIRKWILYTWNDPVCKNTWTMKNKKPAAATRPLDNDILNNTPAPFDPLQLYYVVYIVWSSYLKILFSTLFQIWYIQTRSETCKRTGCCHRLPPLLYVSPLTA